MLEMLYLPLVFLFGVMEISKTESPVFQWILLQTGATPLSLQALLFLVNIALSVWLLWGIACVLVIGKRIIKNPAGRSRSSMSVVRKEASRFVFSLFLTDILRDCMTVLWVFLFIVPGIIFRVRTTFFAVVTVCEGKEYRDALRGSSAAVKGNTWSVLWRLVSLVVMLILPAWVFTLMAYMFTELAAAHITVLAMLISALPLAAAFMFYNLASVHLYKSLKS